MHFAEKREGEGGKAEPVRVFAVNIPFPLDTLVLTPPAEPSAEKFKGRIQQPEDFDDGPTKVFFERLEQYREKYADHFEKYPEDNVTIKNMHTGFRSIRGDAVPHFSDFKHPAFVVGYDYAKQGKHFFQQWKHCQGSLGEDHPTCKKAQWYFAHGTPSIFSNHYQEMEELGFSDFPKKYGIKIRPSFLPQYQPVKKNIPGAYEFYNSRNYLENHIVDDLPTFPFTLVD